MRAKFLGSDGLFCFISICKFGSFKNPFATITSLSELYFRIRRFILLVQMKKVISMNYGSSTSNWKPWRWVRLRPSSLGWQTVNLAATPDKSRCKFVRDYNPPTLRNITERKILPLSRNSLWFEQLKRSVFHTDSHAIHPPSLILLHSADCKHFTMLCRSVKIFIAIRTMEVGREV